VCGVNIAEEQGVTMGQLSPSRVEGLQTKVKSKIKQSRYTPWRRLGVEENSSYSFTTSALDGGEWSASHLCHSLPPGEGPPVPVGQEAGWAPEPVWAQRLEVKSFASARDRTSIARSSSP
jgi:hypothetical protein